jgi:uncharacterized membrane protein
MKGPYWPLAFTIAGGVLYHFAQKSIPRNANPFAAIIIAYVTGIVACAVALRFTSAPSGEAFTWRSLHWTMALMGLGAALIEIGFLLVYRAGWNLSAVSVVVNISVALLLIPLGVIAFRERLSSQQAIGLACCLLGLFLLTRK